MWWSGQGYLARCKQYYEWFQTRQDSVMKGLKLLRRILYTLHVTHTQTSIHTALPHASCTLQTNSFEPTQDTLPSEHAYTPRVCKETTPIEDLTYKQQYVPFTQRDSCSTTHSSPTYIRLHKRCDLFNSHSSHSCIHSIESSP